MRRPPREGSALLQGLTLCGVCGRGMSVQYHSLKGLRLVPVYYCRGESPETAGHICQFMRGDGIDEAVERLLLEKMGPLAVKAAEQVQRELQEREEEADRLRRRDVERCRYEADLAHRRYLHVDPENRNVAASLEKAWNERLQELNRAQEEYEAACRKAHEVVTPEQRRTLAALTRDFPALWKDPRTPSREKKRMVRLLLEDVTLIKGRPAKVHVRFRGGMTQTLDVELPLRWNEAHRTSQEVVEAIRAWGPEKSNREVAQLLNEKGIRTGMSLPFDGGKVGRLRRIYGLTKGSPVPPSLSRSSAEVDETMRTKGVV